MSVKTEELREGFRTITPYLLPPGLEFVDFLKNVFGAEETFRGEPGPGRYHIELRIGDSMLMAGVGSGRNMPMALELQVPDADAVYKRALDAGCAQLQPLEDAHWETGLRLGSVQDKAGNQWVIATRLDSNRLPENRISLSASLVVQGAARQVEFLKQAFGAEELHRHEWPGGLYVSLKIGNSTMGVSEAGNHEWMRPMPAMIYMYVPDCDALYERALRAGAASLTPPTNQSYGDRSGGVTDPWGNMWYIATPA